MYSIRPVQGRPFEKLGHGDSGSLKVPIVELVNQSTTETVNLKNNEAMNSQDWSKGGFYPSHLLSLGVRVCNVAAGESLSDRHKFCWLFSRPILMS